MPPWLVLIAGLRTLSPERIAREENAELRRVMLESYSPPAMTRPFPWSSPYWPVITHPLLRRVLPGLAVWTSLALFPRTTTAAC